MRWSLTQSTNQFHCRTLQQDEHTAELKYNQWANSFRVAASDKRLFFIEKTGFLQNKFLIKTEYSVITGKIYPARNWHSGIMVLENKKYHYLIKDNLLTLSSRKEDFFLMIEITGTANIDQTQLYSLLFSALRIIRKSFKLKKEAALS